jgi:hypothetical protein
VLPLPERHGGKERVTEGLYQAEATLWRELGSSPRARLDPQADSLGARLSLFPDTGTTGCAPRPSYNTVSFPLRLVLLGISRYLPKPCVERPAPFDAVRDRGVQRGTYSFVRPL